MKRVSLEEMIETYEKNVCDFCCLRNSAGLLRDYHDMVDICCETTGVLCGNPKWGDRIMDGKSGTIGSIGRSR